MSAHEVKLREIRPTHGGEYTPPFKGNPADPIEARHEIRRSSRAQEAGITIENVTLRSAYQKIR
jgi:hypothetical protein